VKGTGDVRKDVRWMMAKTTKRQKRKKRKCRRKYRIKLKADG
jgi:hypothetical protein